jgi:FKBP-type peptidyl-prolyl cis-trans isomerase FklB
MKLKKSALLVSGFMALSALAQPKLISTNQVPGPEPAAPDKEKLSYAIGMSMGMNLTSQAKRQDLEVDMDTVLQAMTDALKGRPTKLTEKEVQEMLRKELPAYLQFKQKAQLKKLEAMGDQSKKEGQEFLAKNATAEGVKTLPDGLQYKVLTEGTGESPASNDVARVNYRGTLIDGTEFDKNEDFSTGLNRVIKGWTEALTMMKVGSKWRLFVPSDLAYGTRPQPPKIAANSVLIFDMELLEVKHPPARPAFPSPNPANGALTNRTSAVPGATNGSVVSGQIIRVPSKAELDKGAKIEVIDPSTTNATASGK